MTITAGCATLLAAAPMATLFRSYSWLFYAGGTVVVLTAIALGARSLRTPLWAQIGAMAGGLVLLLSWLFGNGTALLGIVPTPATFGHFVTLLRQGGIDAQRLAAPVPDTDGLLFAIAAATGLVAIVIDALAVGLRQPALAGLPMLAIYSVPVAVMPESISLIPFALGAAGFMWLLAADHIERVRRWGRRFAGDGRDVDPWESSPLAASGRRLGLISVVIAVLLPLAAPTMTAGFLENLVTGAGFGGGGVGDPRSVNLMASLQGNLNRPNPVAMLRVRTTDERPGYLRLGVADRITERGAFPTPLNRDRSLRDAKYPDVDNAAEISRETARVEILALKQGRLPAYLHTSDVEIRIRDDWSVDSRTGVIWSDHFTTERGQQYRLSYLNATFTAEQLRAARDLDEDEQVVREFAEVPENRTVRRLVNRLTAGAGNQYDKTLAIYNHFSRENGFSYNERVTTGTSGSAVVDFLENKEGYCQQYSVTMAWMLRAAGIPARVAIGFTQGAKGADGYIITSSNAHAWVEVYFAGSGWVPFDPTPASGVSHEVELPWAPNPYDPPEQDPGASASPTETGSPAPTSTRPDRRDPGQDAGAGAGGDSEPPTRWPYWLAGSLLALVLLALPMAQRWLRRRRRLRLAGPADGVRAGAAGAAAEDRPGEAGDASGAVPAAGSPVVLGGVAAGAAAAYRAWDELLDTLFDLKIDYQPSDTPRGVARRLTHSRPPLIEQTAPQVELLARSLERAEYSRQPLPGEGLDEAVRAVATELRGTATRFTRVTATLFPRSVLRDWQDRANEAARNAYGAWERAREAATRLLPRRLRAGG